MACDITPEDLDPLVMAMMKAKKDGVPIGALLEAFQTLQGEWRKWIRRYEELALQLHDLSK